MIVADISYGDIGQAIMIRHFQNLILWGHLKLNAATSPLPETDFIVTVLVPEAAVLLTMEDNEWKSAINKGEEWENARSRAMETCKRSGPYGYWRFRGDGDEGRRVLDRLERTSAAKCRRLSSAREELEADIVRKIQAEKVAMRPHDDNDIILVASSDTEVPDASDWSGDEFWDDEGALAAIADAEERRAKNGEVVDVDATPKAKPTRARPVRHSPEKTSSTQQRHGHKKAGQWHGHEKKAVGSHGKSHSRLSSYGDDWDEQCSGQAVRTLDDVLRRCS